MDNHSAKICKILMALIFGGLLAFASPLWAAGPDAAKSDKIIVGVNADFPPYYKLGDDGRLVGYAIDVMNYVADKVGLKVTYKAFKNGNVMRLALEDGSIDVIPSFGITESRKKVIAYTMPFETFLISYFVRADTLLPKNIEDLLKQNIGAVRGNASSRILAKRKDINLTVFPDPSSGLFGLLSARVDVLAFPEPVFWKLARDAGLSDRFKLTGMSLVEIKRGMAIRKEKTELLALLNRGVQDFIASPHYQELYVRYFAAPPQFWTAIRVLWVMSGIIVVILIVLVGWRYRVTRALNWQLGISDAIEGLADGFAYFDKDDKLVAFNRSYIKTRLGGENFLKPGITYEEILRDRQNHGPSPDDQTRDEVWVQERLKQHRNPSGPLFRKFKDGRTIQVNEYRTNEGGIVVLRTDITERKQAEEKIKASLTEKEILLKEIHHRVKNNLQVISSMLMLQAGSETNSHVLEALDESQRRIRVMARIHETLYQSDDLASINAMEFVNTVVEDTMTSTGSRGERNGQDISSHVDVDEFIIEIDQAIACGQIISELLSNALKHAFPNGKSGNIDISLHRRDAGRIELAVADDGIGLPGDFEFEKTQTLGMRLVQALAKQLSGVVDIDGAMGTSIKINFPEKSK